MGQNFEMRGFEFPYYQNGRRSHVFIVFAYAGVIFCKYISFIKLRRDLLYRHDIDSRQWPLGLMALQFSISLKR